MQIAAATPTEPAPARDRRARALASLSRLRAANAIHRLAIGLIAVVIAVALVGNEWPIYWFLGNLVVLLTDRTIHQRILRRCEAGSPPERLTGLVIWTAFQSAYGNSLAILLWFAPYVPGETLAVMYICGGLANAAATLRFSPALSVAGAGTSIAFLLGLPLAEFLIGGGVNVLDLMPMLGGVLLLAFGVNLWKSLLDSDAAQAQAEAAVLRERQAAAAAAAAKSDTIRRMNDELRTPMTALIGAAEHLRRAAASPQARAHIATLVQAGELLKLVLNDLSDLDRLENGELTIETKPADPREIARSVVSAFRAAAQDKQIELFLDVDGETPGLVEIDALRVRQVLFNLVANAVRYTTHGGVRVQLAASAFEGEQGKARLSFSVADTGAGMSRSQLALIFGRERLGAEGDGPGLGLSISRRLARLMGGHLNARSELGQGSVFTLTIDARVAEAEARGAA